MTLKNTVEEVLKRKKRSLSWLSGEMDKSVDGLRLGLVRESIKYGDIKKMAEILEVSPCIFFDSELISRHEGVSSTGEVENESENPDLRYYKGMCAVLKDQLNDKEKIITLLSNSR